MQHITQSHNLLLTNQLAPSGVLWKRQWQHFSTLHDGRHHRLAQAHRNTKSSEDLRDVPHTKHRTVQHRQHVYWLQQELRSVGYTQAPSHTHTECIQGAASMLPQA